MTPNDKQIDLLMRRYPQPAQPQLDGDHLDADELNTFAEGGLPPAARSRYTSHLSQCDQCRKQVAQLAISSGAAARLEAATPVVAEPRSFWQSLGALFAPRVLRYAAFAAVLVIAGGITLIALRQSRRPNDLVASRSEGEQHPASAVQPVANPGNGIAADANSRSQGSPTPLTPSPVTEQPEKANEDRVAQTAPAPTITKEAPVTPSDETKKAATGSDLGRNEPSYAPPPPKEADQPASVAGVAAKQQPRKAETETDKVAAAGRERSSVLSSERDDRSTKDTAVAQQRRAADEKAKGGPSRNFENQVARNANDSRPETGTLNMSASKPKDAEEAQTRSVGGRKFHRQGNAWVDQKFKSSMTLKSVGRGSDDFNALDSGLRSIAQQLNGEVIVVWKGKAYLIK